VHVVRHHDARRFDDGRYDTIATRMTCSTVIAVATAVVLWASAARAQTSPSCSAERVTPWVRLDGNPFEEPLRTRLVVQLGATLAARNIGLCLPDDKSPGTPPVATLAITKGVQRTVEVTLDIHDEVTNKRVLRVVDLGSVPPDARPLAVALAADELLRASWAELLLDDVQKPRDAPLEVHRAVAPPRADPARTVRPWELTAGFAAEHFGGGYNELGLDGTAGVWPFARLGFQARIGFRSGATISVPQGDVRSNTAVLTGGAIAALLPRSSPVGADMMGGVVLTRMSLSAEPNAGARASHDSATAMYVVAGARGWTDIGQPFRLFAEMSLGAPAHTVRVSAGDHRLTALSGLRLAASAGVLAAF
jgi:hypothetical protein